LLVLTVSVSILTVPVQAQQHQSTTVAPQKVPISMDIIRDTTPGFVGEPRLHILGNLQAVLNIIANGAELVGIICGLTLIYHAAFLGKSGWVIPILRLKLGKHSQFFAGCGLIIVGLAISGFINWCIASERYCNLSYY
jgi:hypothetical protein